MTKNKDLKRQVRARMQKTGESFTAARAQVTAPASAPKKASSPKMAAAPETTADPGWAALAGQTDETIRARTGRSWAEWVAALDAIGATEMTHTVIAQHVHELGVPGWWAQTVTVGYERIRGLRAPNQRRGGTFEAGKSRTFAVPVSKLYAWCSEKRKREAWLETSVVVRTSIQEKAMRLTWPDETSVELYFAGKGPTKSTLTLVHKKLASKLAVAEKKAFWDERLGALAARLRAS